MNLRTLLTLSFALVLLLAPAGVVSASIPNAPTAAPCGPASTYNPACDVNHDGVINVVDVQLTADKWNQSGTWFGDNGHDHLGQTWTGNDNQLTVSGTYTYPSAPLVLNNTSGNGLLVNEASAVGVYVQQAGNINPSVSPSLPGTGFEVLGAERVGLQVGQAGVDGVYVNSAGRNGVTVNSSEANGLEVRGAQGNGLYVDQAGQNGVHVNAATGNGLYVGQASESGVYVDAASSNGLYVGSSGLDGVHVGSSDTDGVKVVSAGSPSAMNFDFRTNGFEVAGAQGNGLYVGQADRIGVLVGSASAAGVVVYSTGGDGLSVWEAGGYGVSVYSAGGDGVYANTVLDSGEWGLHTPDKVSGSNVTLSSLTVIARVTGKQALTTGDVVTALGVTDPLPDSTIPLALVQPAKSGSGIIGVVEGRMALTAKPQHEDKEDKEPVLELHSTEGPAQPGDFVALTVLGVAQVKVDASADIQPGQRLTASDVAGHARSLKTVEVEGVRLAEDAPTIGIALAAPEPGQETIPVFVTLR